MPPTHTPTDHPGPTESQAVIRPPLVAFADGVMTIDAAAVREILATMPPTVMVVGFSVESKPSPPEKVLFDAMEQVLREGGEAVVSVRSVSEAVKVVRGDWVVGSRDRSSLITVASPVAFDRGVLADLVKDSGVVGWIDPVQTRLGAGGRVRVFPPA